MRYLNQHQGQPAMHPQQQMQPMQQAPQIVMTAQGPMMMTQQGWVPVPMQQIQQMQQMQPMQQPQMMQMPQGGMMMSPGMPGMTGMGPGSFPQQGMNPQFPGNNQAAVPSRFGTPSNNQAVVTQQQQMSETSGRFNMPQTPQVVEPVEEVVTKPYLFEVTPVVTKFCGNEKFKAQTIVEGIKPNQIDYSEDLVACNCLKESIENVIEQAYAKPSVPPVIVRETISNFNFWQVDMKADIKTLLSGDIKALYKAFKPLYSELTDIRRINVMNALNTMLTNAINDYLIVNAKEAMEIDSFHIDFNDLLKVIRNNEEDLEENLLDYMNKYVGRMHFILTNTPETENATQITDVVTIGYVDKHSSQLGVEELDGKFVEVENCLPNTYLISLAAEVIAKISKSEFLLVTMDRVVLKFMVSEDSKVFIKKVV